MIIYLDRTIGEYCSTNTLKENEIALFSDLAYAHRKGYCLLCGDLTSTEILMAILPETSKSTYKKVYSHFYKIRSIIEKVETLIVISYSDIPDVPDFMNGKCRLLKVDNAITFNLNEKCTLVAEHLDDCKFYALLAQRYMVDQQVRGVDISFHNELGGGNTINKVFEKCILQDKSLTLCVADSDLTHGSTKKFPNAPGKGDTAYLLEKTYKEIEKLIPPVTFELYLLPIHEIENLIPIHILIQISNNGCPDIKKGLGILQSLKEAECTQAILYYDFKKGCEQAKKEPYVEYWNEIKTKLNVSILPCLSSKLMEKAIGFIEENCFEIPIDEYLTILWNDIGLKVFSWGCSNAPIRV